MSVRNRRNPIFARRRARRRKQGLLIRMSIVVFMTLVPVTLYLMNMEPPWRTVWFDLLHQTFPREAPAESPVRVVVLQDQPGGVRLQGTWPRDRLARLIDVIGYSGAHAIGLDVPLDDLGIYELAESRAGDNDPLKKTNALAEALARHRVVTPVMLFDASDNPAMVPQGKRGVGFMQGLADESRRKALADLIDAFPGAPAMQASLSAHPSIVREAAGEGLVIDELRADEQIRQIPMVQLLERAGRPTDRFDSMAVEMVRLGLELPRPGFAPAAFSDRKMLLDDSLDVPVDWPGTFHLYLRQMDPAVSIDADSVLLGRADPAQFRDRYVVITTGYGDFTGRIDTPIFRFATTGELMGQVIEQILAGQFLYRPSWVFWAEIAIFFCIAMIFSTVFRRYSSSRMLPLGLSITFSFLPISVVLFMTTGFMLDGLGLSMGLLIAGGFAMSTYLIERDRRHQETQLALLTERAERSRLDGELDVARQIQMSLLPPQRSEVSVSLEIACHIEPAQTVGGDFYDYVMRPDGQIFFSIGDVSGKGVPASLFMALSKSLWKSAALVHEDLGELHEQANRDITRDNPEQMFVTGVGCLFDPATQRLRYCGAGHDMPILARRGEVPCSLPEISGPPLGLTANQPYPAAEVQLLPGDLVCLFTDGLTEAELGAEDPGDDDFFGVGGVIHALTQATSANADAPAAVAIILDHLNRRTNGSPQSDDRTVVIARVCETGTSVDSAVPA